MREKAYPEDPQGLIFVFKLKYGLELFYVPMTKIHKKCVPMRQNRIFCTDKFDA